MSYSYYSYDEILSSYDSDLFEMQISKIDVDDFLKKKIDVLFEHHYFKLQYILKHKLFKDEWFVREFFTNKYKTTKDYLHLDYMIFCMDFDFIINYRLTYNQILSIVKKRNDYEDWQIEAILSKCDPSKKIKLINELHNKNISEAWFKGLIKIADDLNTLKFLSNYLDKSNYSFEFVQDMKNMIRVCTL